MDSRPVIVAMVGVLLVGCAGTSPSPDDGPGIPETSVPTQSHVTLPSRGAVLRDEPVEADRPAFSASIRHLSVAQRRRMSGVTWRPGCPVPLRDLRFVAVRYNTFGGGTARGRLVAHRDSAGDLVQAFRALYRHRFPIRRMRLVDHYGGSDMRSMKANNTSAFNCRVVPGSGVWSQHAYGRAVDINPVNNPYWLPSGYVEPPRGRRYLDRTRTHSGVIHEGDAVVRAFDRLGWGWGGRWQSLKDWQHFSATGR